MTRVFSGFWVSEKCGEEEDREERESEGKGSLITLNRVELPEPVFEMNRYILNVGPVHGNFRSVQLSLARFFNSRHFSPFFLHFWPFF